MRPWTPRSARLGSAVTTLGGFLLSRGRTDVWWPDVPTWLESEKKTGVVEHLKFRYPTTPAYSSTSPPPKASCPLSSRPTTSTQLFIGAGCQLIDMGSSSFLIVTRGMKIASEFFLDHWCVAGSSCAATAGTCGKIRQDSELSKRFCMYRLRGDRRLAAKIEPPTGMKFASI